MLAAPKVGAPLKWVEDRRENLLAAGKSRHEHGDVRRWRSTADGTIQAAHIDFVQDCGAYPTPWPVDHRGRGRHAVPRPVPRAARRLHDEDDLHEHRRPHRVPRAVAVRDARARGAARHRGPRGWASIRSSCAAATCFGATTCRTRNPNGMTYDNISPLETFEQALAILDYDAFRAEQAEARAAGRYLGVGIVELRRAVDARLRRVRRPRPRRSASSRRARSTCTSPAVRPGNSLETTVVQLAADALGVRHRRRAHDPGRHRGHRLRRRDGREPQRVDDRRRDPRDGDDPARAHPRDRRAPARSRGRRHRARRQPRARARHARRSASRSPRSRPLAYFEPHALPPGVPAGLEASARYTAAAPSIWVNATHVCTCEVDVETGRVDAAALHRERGLRPDDQPRRRRGPDRGRRRAGHRRRALRAPRVRRRRQPARDHVHGLPRAERGRSSRRSSTGTSRRRAPGPAATRASAKAARSARRRPSSTRSPTRSRRSA